MQQKQAKQNQNGKKTQKANLALTLNLNQQSAVRTVYAYSDMHNCRIKYSTEQF